MSPPCFPLRPEELRGLWRFGELPAGESDVAGFRVLALDIPHTGGRRRLKAMGQPKYQVDGDARTSGPGFALQLHDDALGIPLTWRDPRVIFVNSMSDLFHNDVPIAFIRRVFDVMERTPQHTYQVLTKR